MQQVSSFNPNIVKQPGMCLKYAQECFGGTPIMKPNAHEAMMLEVNSGALQPGYSPEGVYTVGWLDITGGPYAGLGHVFINHPDGIHVNDSNRDGWYTYADMVRYLNCPIAYRGWSAWLEGKQLAK